MLAGSVELAGLVAQLSSGPAHGAQGVCDLSGLPGTGR
jgi:hypothetical protein